MSKEKLTIDDLASSAGELNAALIGLDMYIYQNVSKANVTTEDINGLMGLTKAVLLLSNNHRDKFEMISNDGGDV